MRISDLILCCIVTGITLAPARLSAQIEGVEEAALIDAVPGHPFTAQYVKSFWDTNDGTTTQFEVVERVARDRVGRVWRGTPNDDAAVVTSYTIEDPIAHQHVELLTGSHSVEVADASTGERKVITKILNHGAIVIPYPSTVRDGVIVGWSNPLHPWPPDPPSPDFAGTHGRNLPGVEDAGWRTLDGLSLHGYRVATVLEGGGQGRAQVDVRERMKNVFICRYRTEPDDLQADRYTLGVNRLSSRQTRVVLRNLKLGEPDPSLFKIPAEYRVETRDEFDEELQRLEEAYTKPAITTAQKNQGKR